MCYLCLKDDPFEITEPTKLTRVKKRVRAVQIKKLLKDLETMDVCNSGKEEVNKLKEEQYKLSREF